MIIEHISSHKGLVTPEQKGNDKADELANHFRRKGARTAPVEYLLSTEEKFFYRYKTELQGGKTTNLQGDPRQFLKNWKQRG